MREAQGAEREIIDALFHYSGHLNQAFAAVDVVASPVAIILWCLVIRPRWLAG